MRPLLFIGVALIASIAANILSGIYISDLRDKILQLQEVVLIEQSARQADREALAALERSQREATQKARERHNVLQNIPANASDDDILSACRDGLCPTDKTSTHNASPKPTDAMRNANATGVIDER